MTAPSDRSVDDCRPNFLNVVLAIFILKRLCDKEFPSSGQVFAHCRFGSVGVAGDDGIDDRSVLVFDVCQSPGLVGGRCTEQPGSLAQGGHNRA